jgi:arylsulfatase A-like enzyme
VELDPHARLDPAEGGKSRGKTGLGIYPDGMVEHDAHVGELLDMLKELGLEENTIVMYSTDNGAEKFTWPDGGTSPFRGEKNTNWEGGYRVPRPFAGPVSSRPAPSINDIFAHEDMLPTLLRRRRGARREGRIEEGHEGRRQDVQGPPRWLQRHRRAGRQDREPAPRVLLLQRRRLNWSACATTSGKSFSPNNASTA